MKKPMKLTVLAVSVASVLNGCAGYKVAEKEIDAQTKENMTRAVQTHDTQAIPENKGKLPLVSHTSGAWFGAKTVPLQPDAALPMAFNKRVTMMFPGRVNLSTVAERITNVTGVPVRVKPDVFMPATSLMPTGSTAAVAGTVPATATAGTTGTAAPAPAAQAGTGSATGAGVIALPAGYASEMEINYVGDLAGFLNLVTARFGINWEYRDGAIQFYRLVTRTFTVKANPGNTKFSTNIGKSGGTQAGTSSSGSSTVSTSSATFSSNMSVETKAEFSVWDNIDKQFAAVKTAVGRFAISESTGSVTATDTKEVIDEMQKIIDHENGILAKQVVVKVEIVSVTQENGDDFGLDWSLVYSKLASLTPQWTLKTSSAGSLASAEAASLGIQIVAPVTNDNSATQRLTGSQALIKALKSIGNANTLIKNTVSTQNRQAVPVALTDQETYLASTTPGTASTSGGASGLPGLNPGVVTTGYLGFVLPTVQEGDGVMMQFSLDLSVLKDLGIISTGSGATQQSIQTPNVSGTQMQNRYGVRSGETLVLTGFERTVGQYNKRTLSDGAPIGVGGSISATRRREAVLILLTPYIKEGM